MSDFLTDCDPGDEVPRRHVPHPYAPCCTVCGAFSDEMGSFPSRACPGPQEQA